MPLFMDMHKHIPGLTKEAVEGAHAADLATQDKHNVNYMRYWLNDITGDVFCLIDAPNKETAMQLVRFGPGTLDELADMMEDRESHGLLADDIIEVQEGR